MLYSFVGLALFAFMYVQANHNDKNSFNESAAIQIDGPYVFYSGDTITVHYIDSLADGRELLRTEVYPSSQRSNISLNIRTDEAGKTFTVKLKDKLEDEKPTYGKAKQMFILSDIEGSFGPLRKLLQAGGVIDANLNWTFGKGQLVLTGDFVDRGDMVTELLWLIYKLENEAAAAGGKVHYILGNHEIMNMSNDLRYVNERYFNHIKLMNVHYLQLYGKQSEIGRWMATKNVSEKIGNYLFAHGGYSQYVNMMQLDLKELHALVKQFYTDTTFQYPDKRTDILYSDYGPFWYRGYYIKDSLKASMPQVDSTLSLYGVKQIITGHTIIAPQITGWYNGKVINTDVHHRLGHSEALLIEENKMFRLLPTGEKIPFDPKATP